ncbi:hypothetical protein ACFE04_019740 [Oxalis oulophora]
MSAQKKTAGEYALDEGHIKGIQLGIRSDRTSSYSTSLRCSFLANCSINHPLLSVTGSTPAFSLLIRMKLLPSIHKPQPSSFSFRDTQGSMRIIHSCPTTSRALTLLATLSTYPKCADPSFQTKVEKPELKMELSKLFPQEQSNLNEKESCSEAPSCPAHQPVRGQGSMKCIGKSFPNQYRERPMLLARPGESSTTE